MIPKPYLLFDAGGTLVFPDQAFLAQQAQVQGLQITPEQLFAGGCHLIHDLDCEIRAQGRLPNFWPHGYTYALFTRLGVDGSRAEAIVQAAQERNRQKSLWTLTFPWVAETLSHLATEGYRMSIISNADGRVAQTLSDMGLADYFERIFDSTIVGVEKPHPAIFELALRELNLQPEAALYIGDVFYIDVWGANQVGLGAVHLDPLGLYAEWPGIHLPNIGHLPAWLAQYAAASTSFDLFPARAFRLSLE